MGGGEQCISSKVVVVGVGIPGRRINSPSHVSMFRLCGKEVARNIRNRLESNRANNTYSNVTGSKHIDIVYSNLSLS